MNIGHLAVTFFLIVWFCASVVGVTLFVAPVVLIFAEILFDDADSHERRRRRRRRTR